MFSASHPASDHVGDIAQILRLGTVTSVDLIAALCAVEVSNLAGDKVETADIGWGVMRAGQTTIWSPPSIGEQVLLFCPNGDLAQAIPMGALYSATFPAPGASSRDLIQFSDGAVIGYDPAAHHFDITLPASATASINAQGGLAITGDVTITGNLDISADAQIGGGLVAQDDVIGDGISLAHHTHSGVKTGASSTSGPQ